MIDPHKEDLVPINEVPALLPKKRGKPTHVSSIYRWLNAGLRGVRLEWLQVGGVRCTSKQALWRFFVRLSGKEPDDPGLNGGGGCPVPVPRPEGPASPAQAFKAQRKAEAEVHRVLRVQQPALAGA